MSDSSEESWSDNPNAPQIPPWLHTFEKVFFASYAVGEILYGIIVILFFQCIGALIDPANGMRRSVKLGLVAYTVALFSFSTISLAAGRDVLSIIFIDIRNFPGTEEYAPGPAGGEDFLGANPVRLNLLIFPTFVNQWLSDGLLLYRCYVIYGMNYWAIALPSLIYVASIGTSIADLYFSSTFQNTATSARIFEYVNPSYYAICLALNILLTLMIITKLILHRRSLQHAIGTSNAITKVYTTIVIMLVESYALYAIALLSYILTWTLQSPGTPITSKLIGNAAVIAPYLIILRVAKRRALTSEMMSSGSDKIGSIQFASQGTMDGSPPDSDPTDSMQANEEAPRKVGARTEDEIEEVPL